jgi:hypothetical protein
MRSFMHQEYVTNNVLDFNNLKNKVDNLEWIWNDGQIVNLQKVEIDDSYPEYILNNIDKFKHLIKG